jgi:hypothetical protein
VHDLLVHPKELDLVIGTHGKSLYTIDVSGLEQATTAARGEDVSLFRPQDVLMLGRVVGGSWDGDGGFSTPNSQPGTRIQFWLKQPAKETPKIVISDPSGKSSSNVLGVTNFAGLNVVTWNGRVEGGLHAGDYRITLTVDGKDYLQSVHVEPAYLVKD